MKQIIEFKLVVIASFDEYKRGDEITDINLVKQFWKSHHVRRVSYLVAKNPPTESSNHDKTITLETVADVKSDTKTKNKSLQTKKKIRKNS